LKEKDFLQLSRSSVGCRGQRIQSAQGFASAE
jgi:hypothetical protein